MLTPELILGTIQAVANAATETMKFLQTEHGKAVVEKSLADQAAAAKLFQDIGEWFKNLFAGKL